MTADSSASGSGGGEQSARPWLVGGGVLLRGDEVLLVHNRRRGGSLDWSPPGGVIDQGEDVLTGLTREVVEETGLAVEAWSPRCYTIEAVAPDMGWHLRVEAFQALEFSGDLAIDDPDGIVIDAEWVAVAEVAARLAPGPQWVREPLVEWLSTPEPRTGADDLSFRYRVFGRDRAEIRVERD